MKTKFALLFIASLFLLACNREKATESTDDVVIVPEAYSLGGDPLYPIEDSPASQKRKDSLLNIALERYDAHPDSLETIIWLGRRTAYLYHYPEAISIYSEGLEKFPDAPELLRHRGHRYISVRQFDLAIDDLSRAAELAKGRPLQIEPDGIPNRLDIPLSNLQFNIWYHWGLAHYLKGDFSRAGELFRECLEYSVNPDLLCATSDWLYMSYRRSGQDEKAREVLEAIQLDMEIIENEAYFQRLLMYKGLVDPETLLPRDAEDDDLKLQLVTQGYGLGNWYLYRGERERAIDIFKSIISVGYWPAFGHIAAEADLYRLEEAN